MRLSVSDLEAWRYHKASEDSTADELVRRLLRLEPPTPNMLAGQAFAKLLEHAGHRALHDEEQDGWRFYFDLDEEIDLPAVRELKGEMIIATPSGPVTLVGMVDALGGGVVHDAKLSERIDCERYTDSLQWRAYLVMFGAQEFVYDLFRAKYDSTPGRVKVDEYHQLKFYAYPEMRGDVERAVCELAGVVTHLGLASRMAGRP